MTYHYLASPYQNPDDPTDRQYCERRYEEACKAAAKLMSQGYRIFCPIAHSHPISLWLPDHLRTSHAFWLRQDFALLAMADRLIVLQLHQWDRSFGVTQEIIFARDAGIPVEYLDPEDL